MVFNTSLCFSFEIESNLASWAPPRTHNLRRTLVHKKLSRLVTVICMATLLIAFSLSNAQEVAIWGAGTESCGRWVALRADKVNHAVMKQWVLGFISGSNWNAKGSQARPPDADAADIFVDEYCKNNPLHAVALAAAALVQESGGPKAQHEWKR
jgi:hypothetical protein